MHNRVALLFVSLFLIALAAHSQVTVSPYSHYGLGEIFSAASARNFSMGQVGIAAYDQSSINRLNPASYSDMRVTTFDFNGFVNYAKQESKYGSATLGTAGFHNVSFGFSSRKGFGIVMGLAPYTTLGYDVVVRDSILADGNYEPFTSTYKGSGGLNQLFFGAGVRFLHNFRAGVNIAYAFGTNQYEFSTKWDNTGINSGYAEKRATITGIAPQLGLQYGDTLQVNVKVDQLKEVARQQAAFGDELQTIAKEKADLEKEATKIAKWESGKQAEADALGSQKDRMDAAIKNLMVNERENAEQIGKLQDHAYRIEKKRKVILQDIKARKKENTDALARLGLRIEKINVRKAALDQEKADIESGKRDSRQTKTQRYLLRVGGTFDPGTGLNGEQVIRFTNSGIVDTLTNDTGKVKLPSKIGFGFSVARANKWMLAADVSLQNWSNFAYFNETNLLNSALAVNAGAEWIPEVTSSKYARKIAYRIGGYYKASFLTIAGQQIKEYGVSAGVGLPIGFYNPLGKSYSRINVGVNLSRRGDLLTTPMRETTLQFRLGVNLNDIWFIKRRID